MSRLSTPTNTYQSHSRYVPSEPLYWDSGVKKSMIFYLHRPMFDLGPSAEGPMGSLGPLLAYELLGSEEKLGIQRSMTENFRFNLIRESGLRQYAVLSPLEVADAYRTEKWQLLCELTRNLGSIDIAQRVRVVGLLIALGFYREVLKRLPEPDLGVDAEGPLAELAYLRATARYHLNQQDPSYDPTDFKEIVRRAKPQSEPVRTTAMTLMIYYAKARSDLDNSRHYRQLCEDIVAKRRGADDFRYNLILSQFYRGASYVPFLEEDRDAVVREMTLAEELARSAFGTTENEKLVARDNLYFVLESRMREALWLGDRERALSRIAEIVELDPWDSKAHIEMGEVLLHCERVPEAAREYLLAAQLSPPGTLIALYSAGWCYERLCDLEHAVDMYARALQEDPDGISATAGLLRTARAAGCKPLFRWAEMNRDRLSRAGHLVADNV